MYIVSAIKLWVDLCALQFTCVPIIKSGVEYKSWELHHQG